jgi:hypothetical protein
LAVFNFAKIFFRDFAISATGWFDIMRQSWLGRHRTNQGEQM